MQVLCEMNKNMETLEELVYVAKGANITSVRTAAVKSLSSLISDALGQSFD